MRRGRLATVARWSRGAQQDLVIYFLALLAGLALAAYGSKVPLFNQLDSKLRDVLMTLASVPTVMNKLRQNWRLARKTLPWLTEVYSGTAPVTVAEEVFQKVAGELDGRNVSLEGAP